MWNNDISVEELSRQMGIKTKTIYKRFDRLRNELEKVNESDIEGENVDNNVEYVDGDVENNDVEFNGNKESGIDTLQKQDGRGIGIGALIGFAMVAVVAFAFWLYEKWKEWESNEEREKQLLIVQQ